MRTEAFFLLLPGTYTAIYFAVYFATFQQIHIDK